MQGPGEVLVVSQSPARSLNIPPDYTNTPESNGWEGPTGPCGPHNGPSSPATRRLNRHPALSSSATRCSRQNSSRIRRACLRPSSRDRRPSSASTLPAAAYMRRLSLAACRAALRTALLARRRSLAFTAAPAVQRAGACSANAPPRPCRCPLEARHGPCRSQSVGT